MSDTALGRRVRGWLASHRTRSRLMQAYYLGILTTGVLGVLVPSVSAERALGGQELPLLAWTALYVLSAGTAFVARRGRLYKTEALAVLLLMAGTILHGVFLIAGGMNGLQTGARLLVGPLALGAVASALYELALTGREGQMLVDPELVRRIVAEQVEEVAAQRATRNTEDGS